MFRTLSRACSLILLTLASCCPLVWMFDAPWLSPQPALERSAVAHRGSIHAGEPDNSLAAFQEALNAGVGYLEVDVRRSDEGDLFLFHDGSLQPSNFSGPSNLSGSKVQQLSRPDRSSVLLDGSERIPTVEQALEFVKGKPLTLQMDFKGESDELVLEAVDIVRSRKQTEHVRLQIRSPKRIPVVLEREPRMRILARVTNEQELQESLTYPIECVELEGWFSTEAIQAAHARGVKVLINVASSRLDDKKTWDYLRSRGIDTIMTDHADQALR